MSFAIVYVTHENESAAQQIAEDLLEQKLIACANCFPMSSAYWWEGDIQNEQEWISILKTSKNKWPEVKSKLEEIHPYDVPCIMKIEVEANESYENWIEESVS